jgi:hypothetical protein
MSRILTSKAQGKTAIFGCFWQSWKITARIRVWVFHRHSHPTRYLHLPLGSEGLACVYSVL